MYNRNYFLWILILLGLSAASCNRSTGNPPVYEISSQTPSPSLIKTLTAPSPTRISTTPPPTASQTPTGTPTSTSTSIPFSIQPQSVEFKTSDGITLHGTYYPATINPAPLIVLMHWTRGDETEWREIAYWLQNRRQGRIISNLKSSPWLDPSWFPKIQDDRSYALFTFTYRDCVDGCGKFLQMGMLLDSRAAMLQAVKLEGISPGKIVAVGASVGADGAAAGCNYLNSIKPNNCQGAFALSPGNYLPIPFLNTVSYLQQQRPPKPIWCLYSEGDEAAEKACLSGRGKTYQTIMYKGGKHGLDLIKPGVSPNVLQTLLNFLDVAFGS